MATLYDFSIPALTRGLTNMSAILDKAAAYATAKKIDSTVLAQTRLFPDMHPLSRQVQIACDTAKGAAGRLAGIEVPKHEDTETTLPELKARIAKTLDYHEDRNRRQGRRRRCPRHRNQSSPMARGNSPRRATSTISCCRIFIFTPAWSTHCCARAAWKSARGIFSAPSSKAASSAR